MSKTLDYLKKLQEKRVNEPPGKYAQAVNIAQGPASRKIPTAVFYSLIAVSMGINAMAIFFLANASSKNKSNTGRIAEIEQAMGKAIKKLETHGADMKKSDDAITSINNKLKETNKKVTQLEKDIVKTQETARFDIENLNKAKNAMQNKISVLADKINESKNAKQQ
ncbi:hypothetical protein EPN16_02535 [bacterium]|nr:MAG: hypothetical protein EPN16_02535 [bacterium]